MQSRNDHFNFKLLSLPIKRVFLLLSFAYLFLFPALIYATFATSYRGSCLIKYIFLCILFCTLNATSIEVIDFDSRVKAIN